MKQTEHQIQSSFIAWCDVVTNQHPEAKLFFAIPNGANKSIATAMKFKREGLKSGVPDLMLPVARGEYHGLFMEFKRSVKEKLSPKQIDWAIKLEGQGYKVVTVSTRDMAIAVFKRYINFGGVADSPNIV